MWKPYDTEYDWNEVLTDLRGNQQRRNEAPHLSYLGGTNPGWPVKVLKAAGTAHLSAPDRIPYGRQGYRPDSVAIIRSLLTPSMRA